jgi:protein subunit release factor B
MKFPSDSPVTSGKLEHLRQKIAQLGIDLNRVDEQFIRASGPGGQNVNKTETGVQLHYTPLDVRVKWTRERSRALNRFLALRELVDEIEMRVSPGTSSKAAEITRIRKQKDRRRRR